MGATKPRFPTPEVAVISFFAGRSGFTFPVETYTSWVVLGCTTGRFEFAIGESEPTFCEEGQFVICPPRMPLKRVSDGPISFYFIRFRWPSRMVTEWAGVHALHGLGRMESTLDLLKQLNDQPLADDASRWANHLLMDLFQQRAYELATKPASPELAPDRLMLRIAETLRQNLTSQDSLEMLATAHRLTPSQLTRRFTAAFGQSPVAYRTAARLQEARKLLTETTLNLQAIATRCGYENAFYFTRVFTREVGQAPGRYRKARRV